MNPYKQPLAAFLQRISLLNGTRNIVETQLAKTRQSLVAAVSSNATDAPAILNLSRMFVFDLTAQKEDRWKVQFVTSTFSATDDAYIETLDDFLRRTRASTVAQAFEAFETFLMDSMAGFLLRHPDKAGPAQVKDYEKLGLNTTFVQADYDYWKLFVRAKMRGADKALQKMRAEVTDFAKGERNNVRGMDLSIWFNAMYETRHAAVHADFIIKPERLDGWSHQEMLVLHSNFKYRQDGDQRPVDLTLDQTKRALELFNDYALFVFKNLSNVEGLEWKADLAGVLVHE